jgi:hypothetical protein
MDPEFALPDGAIGSNDRLRRGNRNEISDESVVIGVLRAKYGSDEEN